MSGSLIRDAQTLMELEAEYLAPYAMKSFYSEGREHPESPAKTRTPYQRDWHRITHSRAFRRLEFKTQVFVYGEGGSARDIVRNRLTHTLEVSQIATSICRTLGLNEDLAMAISLAHDLGHTPFGHAGEDALTELVSTFNHNVHSLRIVRSLEKRYPDFDGLNLTLETLEGIEKHDTDFDRVHYHHFHPGEFPPLEAQVASVADVIAYRAHDVEDGLLFGILTYEMLNATGIGVWEQVSQFVDEVSDQQVRISQVSRLLIDAMVQDVVEETARRISENSIDSLEKVRKGGGIIARFSEGMKKDVNALGAFLMDNFYTSHQILRMTNKGKMIIRKLFTEYKMDPRLLPKRIKDEYDLALAKGGDDREPDRVIADYIAGMTDRFAEEEYLRLFEVGHKV